MEKTPSNQVHVKNISAEASEKTITDFFGFCGKITSITLLERAQEVPVKEAIIEFQEVNAAKTAILLSNAMIVDRAITVSYYDPQAVQESTEKGEEQPKVTSVKTENEIENRPHIVPASERSNTSVVASLLAAGYTLGTDALQKARDYDEQHMITSTIKGQAEALKEKVTELDTSLGISATASSWASSASSFFGGLGISEKAAALRQSSSNLLQSVGESEVVTTTAATLSGMKEVVVEVAGTIKEEASKLMEEPAIKVVSEKLTEGKEVVKGVAEEVEKGVMSVAGETSRLISENLTKPTNPDDEALLVVLEEEEGGVASKPEAEQINPPDEAKKN